MRSRCVGPSGPALVAATWGVAWFIAPTPDHHNPRSASEHTLPRTPGRPGGPAGS
jgi:hypothetical protein